MKNLNIPNRLSLLRICLVPVCVLLLYLPGQAARIAALIVFCIAAFTDFLDGQIARRQHIVTTFGKFIDPVADKLLVLSTMIALCGLGEFPAWACIVVLFRELDVNITKQMAEALYIAISTDTGGFIYSNVTAATHRAAAELMDTGIDYRAVNKLFFQTKSRVRMQLEAAMLAEAESYDSNRTAVLSVPRSLLEKFHATESDSEDLSALGPQIQGVDCAVTMRELGDGVWKFSLRTGERVNATEVCRLLGGGGHARAAGATLEGVTQAEAEGKMLDAIARIVPDFKK